LKILVTSPFNPISSRLASHRGAQGHIYWSQLRECYPEDVVVDIDTGDKPYHRYDVLYIYHGNDWSGALNVFGGFENFNQTEKVISLANFTGAVYSIGIPMPMYHEIIQKRVDSLSDSGPWTKDVMNSLKHIVESTPMVDVNINLVNNMNIVAGDSHAICMYRPGWLVNSVPFKTLHGAISEGLDTFVYGRNFNNIELYFGNIDIRHHLLRQPDPELATISLVDRYIEGAVKLASKYEATVTILAPLPIENESRKIPKTGWYKGTPFTGSWADRNRVRKLFIARCEYGAGQFKHVKFNDWTGYLINEAGELDFKYMEKPRSVHLSREFYPHWTGADINSPAKLEALT
jgi:hypothetical protein